MDKLDLRQDAGFVRFENVTKRFNTYAGDFTALNSISFSINRGEFVSVVGRSGSGKSTLLNMLTAIDRPTEGRVFVDGAAVHLMDENQSALWRGATIGIVFQFFQLLPTLTILENIMLPMEFGRRFTGKRISRAKELLKLVGIEQHAGKLPAALSGGEQQRAAIARALANDPPILIADEPTGNLDSHTAGAVLDIFSTLSKDGRTIVMVTHEKNGIEAVSRKISLADGMIVS